MQRDAFGVVRHKMQKKPVLLENNYSISSKQYVKKMEI